MVELLLKMQVTEVNIKNLLLSLCLYCTSQHKNIIFPLSFYFILLFCRSLFVLLVLFLLTFVCLSVIVGFLKFCFVLFELISVKNSLNSILWNLWRPLLNICLFLINKVDKDWWNGTITLMDHSLNLVQIFWYSALISVIIH
jgi:hypothetical protein